MIVESKGSESFCSTSWDLMLVNTGKVKLAFGLLDAAMFNLLSWLFLSLKLEGALVDGESLSTLGRLPVRLNVELLSSGFATTGYAFYQLKTWGYLAPFISTAECLLGVIGEPSVLSTGEPKLALW
jgi:hypothetical protein